MGEVEFTAAKGEQLRALRMAVRQRELTPAAAEAKAAAAGLPAFITGYEERHDITSNSTWWLPVAVLFYAWRDLAKTRREYERFETWGRDLWRDPKPDDSVQSLQKAEQTMRADLGAGIVRAFGTNGDHVLVPIPPAEWQDLQFAGKHPLSACRADGSIAYSGVFVLRHEVVPLWLQETLGLMTAVQVAPEPMQRERSEDLKPQKRGGGRPLVYDWDAMWIEVVRLADAEKIKDRPALSKHLLEWFIEKFGEQPGETIFKEKMSKLFTTLGWE